MTFIVFEPLLEGGSFKQAKVLDFVEAVSYNYKKHRYNVGTFSLTVPKSVNGIKNVRDDMLLLVLDDNTDDSLVITSVKDEDEYIIFRGYDLKQLLKWRITLFPTEEIEAGTYGYDVATGTTGSIIRHYIDYNMGAGAPTARRIHGIGFGRIDAGITEDTYMSRMQPVNEVVETLCKNADIGYSVDIIRDGEPSGYIVTVSEGVDRTNGQSENPKMVFADYTFSADSITAEIMTDDRENLIWAINGGTEDTATVTAVNNSSDTNEPAGFLRRETVTTINCDAEDVEIYAKKDSADKVDKTEIKIQASIYSDYGTRYNVGDKVTAIKSGIPYDVRVLSAEKNYSGSHKQIIITLGDIPEKKIVNRLDYNTLQNKRDTIEQRLDRTESGGSGTGGNHFFGTTAPGVVPTGSDGDYWIVFSGEPETGLTNVTKAYKMVSSSWQEQTFTIASQSTPQPANPDYGDLYVIPSSGDGKSVGQILEYVHFNYDSSATPPFDWEGTTYSAWLPFYPTDNNGVSHDCNTSAGGAAENGDIWFKTTSASNNIILAIYERVNGNWLEQGTFESRGVGKNVGNHNEVFNDYSNNIINTSSSWNDYNHLEGHDNTATNSAGAHIEGHDNVVSGASNTHVGGYGNSVGTNSGASDCFVHGEENTVDGLASAAFGAFNVIKSGDHSFAVGNGNSTGACGIALGHHNNSLKNGGTSGGYVVLLGGYLDTDGYNDVIMLGDHCTATESNQFVYGTGVGNGNLLTIDYHGNVAATAFNPTGADYAEYFEWSDGNPDSEDRRGLLVSLDGDKISLANGDDILGIVSAAPSVTGNSAALGWHGRYKTDVFGVPIRDEEGKPILSDDYDRDVKYIPRSQRPEWAAIGLVGRLIVCDNGKCTVGGYVSARNGIAVPTRTKTNVRVLRRVDDTHIEVLIR